MFLNCLRRSHLLYKTIKCYNIIQCAARITRHRDIVLRTCILTFWVSKFSQYRGQLKNRTPTSDTHYKSCHGCRPLDVAPQPLAHWLGQQCTVVACLAEQENVQDFLAMEAFVLHPPAKIQDRLSRRANVLLEPSSQSFWHIPMRSHPRMV